MCVCVCGGGGGGGVDFGWGDCLCKIFIKPKMNHFSDKVRKYLCLKILNENFNIFKICDLGPKVTFMSADGADKNWTSIYLDTKYKLNALFGFEVMRS